MKKFCLLMLLVVVFILAGCADSSKYIKIVIEEGAVLYVDGNIDPSFLREGTTETDTQTVSPTTDLGIIPIP